MSDLSLLDSGETSDIFIAEDTRFVLKRAKHNISDASDLLEAEQKVLQAITVAALHTMAGACLTCGRLPKEHFALFEGWTPRGELLMERKEGQSLACLLSNDANVYSITTSQIAQVVLDVCRTLQWLQTEFPGFRHGDLHTGNVMVDTRWNIVLIDFSHVGQVCTDSPLPRVFPTLPTKYPTCMDVLQFLEFALCCFPRDTKPPLPTRVWLAHAANAVSTLPTEEYIRGIPGGYLIDRCRNYDSMAAVIEAIKAIPL